MARKDVLVVDDEPVVGLFLIQALRLLGLQACHCDRVESALEAMSGSRVNGLFHVCSFWA